MINKIITSIATLGWMATGAMAYAQQPLTVVELFTSEGCSSCPPADLLLQSLAAKPEILALSFHVNYWDYIGWKDPFASQQSTDRQRHYARALQSSNVFTPQMIIAGRYSVVGSDADAIQNALGQASKFSDAATITIAPDAAHNQLVATIAPVSAGKSSKPLDIWLVQYQKEATSKVQRGENAGETLAHAHVVRTIEKLGTWNATVQAIALPAARNGADAVAVLLQEPDDGAMVAAAKYEAL